MSTRNHPRRTARPMPPRRVEVNGLRMVSTRLPIVDETSAGGVIIRIDRGTPYVAVIARRNRAGRLEWCLPKGHVEEGETHEEAALREVYEETGIRGRIIVPVASIDYWFSSLEARIHKVVHHYLLEYVEGTITVENDPDHEAIDATWMPLRQVGTVLTYPNERRVVAIATSLLYPDE